MRFVIIRHAQSTNNLLWERTGETAGRHPDAPLTDLGHTQAQLLAAAIAAGVLPWEITSLHSSLMMRAVQTAAPLAEALGLDIYGRTDSHEVGGVFVDEDDDGVRRSGPGASAAELRSLTDALVLPSEAGAEGWFDGSTSIASEVSTARAHEVITDLRARHTDDDVVALITHGAFFQYLFRELLGIEQITGWVRMNNTAISLFEEAPRSDHAAVSAFATNWMPHLRADHVSH